MPRFFIFVVLFLPDGIAGWPERLFQRVFGCRLSGDEVNLAVKIEQKSPELELTSCSLSIGTVDILNQLSFRIAQPGIYCLIGPNGAGKTSTFNAITGAVKIQAGNINLDDELISGFLSHDVAMRGIGRKFQVPSILPNLTISENLRTALWGGRCSLMVV